MSELLAKTLYIPTVQWADLHTLFRKQPSISAAISILGGVTDHVLAQLPADTKILYFGTGGSTSPPMEAESARYKIVAALGTEIFGGAGGHAGDPERLFSALRRLAEDLYVSVGFCLTCNAEHYVTCNTGPTRPLTYVKFTDTSGLPSRFSSGQMVGLCGPITCNVCLQKVGPEDDLSYLLRDRVCARCGPQLLHRLKPPILTLDPAKVEHWRREWLK